jgi:hypothetical protein
MRVTLIFALALLLAACGGGSTSAPPPATATDAPTGNEATGAPAPAAGQAAPAAPAASSGPALGGRTGELVNPDSNTMVFLYYDLAGITPPINNWVERDSRVTMAPAIDKAAQRAAIRAELEAGMAAVRGVGFLRISLASANLSDYDPTYSEFTIRALAPSSVIDFDAFGQKVAIKFANGRTAQIWHVAPEEAQGIRDRIPLGTNVELDTHLKITAVQPGPAGGTLPTEVLGYEMRETRGGTTLVRTELAQP